MTDSQSRVAIAVLMAKCEMLQAALDVLVPQATMGDRRQAAAAMVRAASAYDKPPPLDAEAKAVINGVGAGIAELLVHLIPPPIALSTSTERGG